MRLVSSVEEIEANVARLETARTSGNSDELAEYRSLIRRGTCFLPYETAASVAFAPSRFIGYSANNFERHRKNAARDGRVTNRAINRLLEAAPQPNGALEQLYLSFCRTIGVEPSKTGTFGVRRKYWVGAGVDCLLEDAVENSIKFDPALSSTEKARLIQARRGQGAFRDRVMHRWEKRCCLTGCDVTTILRASHIKPWRVSSNRERLDQFNGLLLAPNIDALFDKGLVSFQDDGRLLISAALGHERSTALGCPTKRKVALSAKHLPYLQYHRVHVFQGA